MAVLLPHRWTTVTMCSLHHGLHRSDKITHALYGDVLVAVQASVVDNCDGVYALQFMLPFAGDWELTASVAGREVPCPAASCIRAHHGPLMAEECEIENVDGRVSCGTSDPIFIQVLSWPLAYSLSTLLFY
jgi:hypothetical protein